MSSKPPPKSGRQPGVPTSAAEEAKKPGVPLEIQARDLKRSGFSGTGTGTSRRGPPGGAIYEKAKSRHRRHREVYKSSERGQAIAEQAVALGGGRKGPHSQKHQHHGESSARSLKRKSLLDAARLNKSVVHTKKMKGAPSGGEGGGGSASDKRVGETLKRTKALK